MGKKILKFRDLPGRVSQSCEKNIPAATRAHETSTKIAEAQE